MSCGRRRCVLHGPCAHRRRGLRPGRFRAGIGLVEQGHTVAIIDRNAKAFRRLPAGLAGHRRSSAPASTATTSTGPGPRGDLAGRRDQRRQHQHPHRPHRPRDLRDPERGRPHLRPPSGPDLSAAGHPHRGHRVVDHRPGPPPPDPRRGGVANGPTRPARCPWSSASCPSDGRQAPGRPVRPRRGHRGGRHPGRYAPASTSTIWSARTATSST